LLVKIDLQVRVNVQRCDQLIQVIALRVLSIVDQQDTREVERMTVQPTPPRLFSGLRVSMRVLASRSR
jgi:hypothetical protein